jgi:hypothetical protein
VLAESNLAMQKPAISKRFARPEANKVMVGDITHVCLCKTSDTWLFRLSGLMLSFPLDKIYLYDIGSKLR